MNNYIKHDLSDISGCLFNYKDKKGRMVNFYYLFGSEYFLISEGGVFVSFKFVNLNKSNEVEVFIPQEYVNKINHVELFDKLRVLIEEYPIVSFIRSCSPLNEKKLEFIESNSDKVGIIETEDYSLLLDVHLPSLQTSNRFTIVKDSDSVDNKINASNSFSEDSIDTVVDSVSSTEQSINKERLELKKYFSYYDEIISCLKSSFDNNGYTIMISSKVSRKQGLKFYLIDSMSNNMKSSIIKLKIEDRSDVICKCIISDFVLDGAFQSCIETIVKCIESVLTLSFIDSIIFDTSIDNRSYNYLNKLGYSTSTGVLVPKADMIKINNI